MCILALFFFFFYTVSQARHICEPDLGRGLLVSAPWTRDALSSVPRDRPGLHNSKIPAEALLNHCPALPHASHLGGAATRTITATGPSGRTGSPATVGHVKRGRGARTSRTTTIPGMWEAHSAAISSFGRQNKTSGRRQDPQTDEEVDVQEGK